MKQQKIQQKQSPPSPLPKEKQIIFKAITILLLGIVLLLVEAALRYGEYGGNLELVNRQSINGKDYYVINRGVGKRYFTYSGALIPEPADDKFETHKSKKTKRIFCLGESTMAGFPYDFNATAPSFLRDRLSSVFPEYHIEIINIGLSAISSYVILDFMKDLMSYEPDLFIVYSGHNEFYGAYGVGSAVNIPGGEFITRFTISLLRYKTFLLARDGYMWLGSLFSSPVSKSDVTLMEQMVGRQSIPYHSTPYNDAREIYRRNITSMILLAQDHNVPIMFSELVSNLSDQPPFIAKFSISTSPEVQSKWESSMRTGDTLFAKQHFDLAKNLYYSACTLDSMNAAGWFQLGKAFSALNRFDSAKFAFERAKDFDELRFRASEEFKSDLQNICGRFGVPLARVDSAFSDLSPNAITGKTLILEHLHPNMSGYFLMGKVFAKTITENDLLSFPRDVTMSPGLSDDEYWNRSGATEFDRLNGIIKVDLLTHSWPFSASSNGYSYHPKNTSEQIVSQYVGGKSGWSETRYTLSEYFAEIKEFEKARQECFAVHKVIPTSYQPLLRIADYYRAERKTTEAIASYVRCYETEDNPYARIKLSIIYIERGEFARSIEQLVKVFSTTYTGNKKLTSSAESSARYLLAVAYVKQNNFSAARQQLEYALTLQPENADAKSLIDQLTKISPR